MRTKIISLDVFGDRYPWERNNYSAGDNSAAICALKKAMLAAVDTELTDSQRRIIYASYFEGKSITAIAEEMNIDKSVVSRHRKRALKKLNSCLKYCVMMINDLGVIE